MCKETKRELDKWVMELAHYLEAEYELEWSEALRKAHLTKTILGLMGTSVVRFTYRKQDGTLREARGTLCRQMSAGFAAYQFVMLLEVFIWPRATFSYWDMDKNGFRSFSADRLIEVKS